MLYIKGLVRKAYRLALWQQVLLAMILGVVVGHLGSNCHLPFRPLAMMYMNLVKMVVIPTVFFAIIHGLTNISDLRSIGRLGAKACLIYLGMTALAVAIGVGVALWAQPGLGINLGLGVHPVLGEGLKLEELFINMFPSNPILAMAEGQTLQVVFFALIFGLALVMAGDKGREARTMCSSITSAVFKMVGIVVKLTPYGAFFLMAWMVAEHGLGLIASLAKLMITILVAFGLQYLVFGIMLWSIKLSPWKFCRKTANVQSLAFASSSSKATLMLAIEELQTKLGVSNRVANFVLPLGAAINMTGSAIYIAICALFFVQSYGISLTFHQYLVLLITATIGSIGAAGYPSGAVIMLSMVLPAVGLPIDGIPLIMGIDRGLDMARTAVNVTGDCAATVIVDRLEGQLDLAKYNR